MDTPKPTETIDITDEPPRSLTGQIVEHALTAVREALDTAVPGVGAEDEHVHSSGLCKLSPIDNQPELTQKLIDEFHSNIHVADPSH